MTSSPRMVSDDAAGRTAAIEVLRSGGVVALPTDTVYGIAVALGTPGGIERLFRIKERPLDKGIVLLLAEAAQAWELGVRNERAARLADAFWPGPLTLVLERGLATMLPDVLTGGRATIGVRVPDHAAPRALAAVLGPLPTTSANLSGEPDALDAETVRAQLGDRVDLILDGGQSRGAGASTVVDCSQDPVVILRQGMLDEGRIRDALA